MPTIVGVDERKEEKGGRHAKGEEEATFALTEGVGGKIDVNRVAVIDLNLHLAARKLPRQFTCSVETRLFYLSTRFTVYYRSHLSVILLAQLTSARKPSNSFTALARTEKLLIRSSETARSNSAMLYVPTSILFVS